MNSITPSFYNMVSTYSKLEYKLVCVYVCDMIIFDILFMSAKSGIYYFKACNFFHSMKEK